MIPEWLPDKISLNGNNVADNYRQLHKVYCQDFADMQGVRIEDCQVIVNTIVDKHFISEGYTYGFTHLVTRGDEDRIIDFERASRLSWVKAVIDNYTEPEVTAFWVLTAKGPSLVLWLAELDFAVFLRDPSIRSYQEELPSEGSRIIVTAYHLDHSGKQRLQNQYGNAVRILAP